MLAVIVRWFFHFELDMHWAVCIGAVSLLLQPWLSIHFGPGLTAYPFRHLLLGTGLAVALMSIIELIHDLRSA